MTRSAFRTRPCSCFVLGGACLVLLAWPADPLNAQELPRASAKAPENHVALKKTVSGGYFVAKPLKEEYDKLLGSLRLLKADIDAGTTSGASALRELADLQTKLEALRLQIEAQKVLVPIAKEHQAQEAVTFDLGKERCLVISANDVRVVGWDQPGVKCELDKTVLSTGAEIDQADLAAIKVVHVHGRFPEKVGRTQAEVDADEERFLATQAGKGLSLEARESRRKLVAKIRDSWSHMRDFQGKEIDLVEIEGITHQQGNRQMTLEVSYAGGRSVGSEWQRHARLTVYVPACKAVAVRTGGGTSLVSMDVEKVKASLVLWSGGTPKSGHSGAFRVRGLEGSLAMHHVPLDLIEDVTGNVTIAFTSDLSGHSTRAGQGGRALTHEPPLACACRNIGGDLTAWFARADLQLEKIGGRIDVRNEFGDTKLTAGGPLSKAAHRIVSESGRIDLDLTRSTWGDLPLLAVTQSGHVRTNTSREFLEEFSYGAEDGDGARRSWIGLKRIRSGADRFDPQEFLDLTTRFGLILGGKDRPAGLDLISRGGTVVVQTGP